MRDTRFLVARTMILPQNVPQYSQTIVSGPMFNPARLSLARITRRLTAKALADKAGLVPDTISRLENGLHPPDAATVARLAASLEFPASFFERDDPCDIDTGAVSFRSFSKMSARERDAAVSAGSLGLELCAWVEERFTLPNPDLLDLSYEQNPDIAASSVHQYWDLGKSRLGTFSLYLKRRGSVYFHFPKIQPL